MKLKKWLESEASLGSAMPEMIGNPYSDRGAETPASDQVKRTGLQPQVDTEGSKFENNPDKIMALDANIERFDTEIPEDCPKVNKFKQLWMQLKEKWGKIKTDQEENVGSNGLGDETGDQKYINMMQQNPNMTPQAERMPHGPGIFGQS